MRPSPLPTLRAPPPPSPCLGHVPCLRRGLPRPVTPSYPQSSARALPSDPDTSPRADSVHVTASSRWPLGLPRAIWSSSSHLGSAPPDPEPLPIVHRPPTVALVVRLDSSRPYLRPPSSLQPTDCRAHHSRRARRRPRTTPRHPDTPLVPGSAPSSLAFMQNVRQRPNLSGRASLSMLPPEVRPSPVSVLPVTCLWRRVPGLSDRSLYNCFRGLSSPVKCSPRDTRILSSRSSQPWATIYPASPFSAHPNPLRHSKRNRSNAEAMTKEHCFFFPQRQKKCHR